MDLLDSLVHQQTEEDHGRSGGREVELTEELVLTWAGLVNLQITREAVGSLDRHPFFQAEPLRRASPPKQLP